MDRFIEEGTATNQQIEQDFESFKMYVDLWASENPIKTNKLQVLLVVNGLLVSALQVAGGFVATNWPIFLAGATFSLVWTLSIGRTSLFQKYWQEKIINLSTRYSGDDRFQALDVGPVETEAPGWLRLLGGVSSKYYLLGAPVVFTLFWVVVWFALVP